MAVPLLSCPAGTGIGILLSSLLPVELVAIVWLFPSDRPLPPPTSLALGLPPSLAPAL